MDDVVPPVVITLNDSEDENENSTNGPEVIEIENDTNESEVVEIENNTNEPEVIEIENDTNEPEVVEIENDTNEPEVVEIENNTLEPEVIVLSDNEEVVEVGEDNTSSGTSDFENGGFNGTEDELEDAGLLEEQLLDSVNVVVSTQPFGDTRQIPFVKFQLPEVMAGYFESEHKNIRLVAIITVVENVGLDIILRSYEFLGIEGCEDGKIPPDLIFMATQRNLLLDSPMKLVTFPYINKAPFPQNWNWPIKRIRKMFKKQPPTLTDSIPFENELTLYNNGKTHVVVSQKFVQYPENMKIIEILRKKGLPPGLVSPDYGNLTTFGSVRR